MGKGRLQMGPIGRLLAWGSCRQAKEKGGILCDWLGGPIWFSLVDPKLEAETKVREALSD